MRKKEFLSLDPETRVTGWVKYLINNDEFGFIEPDHEEGRKHVEFTYHQIGWDGPGFPYIPVNERVEFSTCSWDDGTVRAIRITKPGGENFRLSDAELKELEEMRQKALEKQQQQQQQREEAQEKAKKAAEQQKEGGDAENEKKEKVKTEKTSNQKTKKKVALPSYMTYVKSERLEIILPARPRPEGMETLTGIVVDYNLPSLKGILQPVAGPEGGEKKELLQFDISQLQCEGFRAVEQWKKVEFSRVEKNGETKAGYVTSVGNHVIDFDETAMLQRERFLIEAHRQRMMKRSRNTPPVPIHRRPPGSRKNHTRTWMGPMPFPIGMPPFPPMMMGMPFPMMDMPPPFFPGPPGGFMPPPFPGPGHFQQFMPY